MPSTSCPCLLHSAKLQGTDLKEGSTPQRCLCGAERHDPARRLRCYSGLGNGASRSRGARRLPSAALRGARKIAANSPSALLKPQVTDNYSAHLLRPI